MKTRYSSISLVAGLAGLAGGLLLSGCSANFGDVSNTTTATAMHIQGIVHGGQQSLNGAHVYMYAASTAGYGGSGIAASTTNASTSLLTASTGVTTSDGTNFYVTTDQEGNFNIDGAFACTPGTQVYLYSTGGDPQLNGFGTSSGVNSAAGMLAVLGDCASATPSAAFPSVTFVTINEVSTIAAAYALAGFATDATHIGAPSTVTGHTLSATGIATAFSTAVNIVSQATGLPTGTTTATGSVGTVPTTLINTLADILANCVNSTGPSSSGCSTLFGDAKNSAGTAPTDTATAAINIAQNPTQNVTALLNTIPSVPPFTPTVSSATSFTLAVNYTGGGLNAPVGIAVDASGNIWLANQATAGGTQATGRVSKFSSLGVPLSGTTGYTGGGLILGQSIAIDNSGNAWVGSTTLTASVNNLSEFTSAGAAISGASGFTGGGLNNPIGLAIDQSGNVWTANDGTFVTGVFEASKFNSSGVAISPADGYPDDIANGQGVAIDIAGNVWLTGGNGTGNKVGQLTGSNGALITAYTGAGLDVPLGVAIDNSNNVWISNDGNNTLSEFTSNGVAISPTTGYTGGGLNNPGGVAIDGAGKVWTSAANGNALCEFNSSGTAISPSAGFTGGSMNVPDGVAIDGAGNVWTPNAGGQSLTEFIGAATPVVTPLVANLTTGSKLHAQKP